MGLCAGTSRIRDDCSRVLKQDQLLSSSAAAPLRIPATVRVFVDAAAATNHQTSGADGFETD